MGVLKLRQYIHVWYDCRQFNFILTTSIQKVLGTWIVAVYHRSQNICNNSFNICFYILSAKWSSIGTHGDPVWVMGCPKADQEGSALTFLMFYHPVLYLYLFDAISDMYFKVCVVEKK